MKEYSNLPEISGWAALRAVVERGGVLEAAKVLRIGQPAVTKRLKALDAIYGTALFERVGGRLRLTPAGEKVYLLAVQTLDRQAALYDELQRLAHGTNRLRIEATFAIGEHLLPRLLVAFAEEHPEYEVSSRLAYGRRIQTHLATHLADIALVEDAPDHPELLVQKWMDDELWLVAGASHPLAHVGSMALEQLGQYDFVMREQRSAVRNAVDEALERVGVGTMKVAMEVGSTDAIIEILSHGLHLSFLPRFAVEERVGEGRLVHVSIAGFRILRTLWIARNREALDHPAAEAFIKLLRRR